MKTVFDDSDNQVVGTVDYSIFTKPGIILVLTGSFDLFHKGHYNAVRLAYQYAINNGFDVAGIIIATDHDAYVNKKNAYRKSYSCLGRMAYIKHFLDGVVQRRYPCPIFVDPWMSTCCTRDVLFKTYLKHLETQLPNNGIAYIMSNEYAEEIEENFKEDGLVFCIQRSLNHPLVIPKDINTYPNKDSIYFVPNPIEDIASSKLLVNIDV